MTFLDFFAGIGGFRRGMELAGHECLGFCEWDKFATASYVSMHCITDEQREYLATLDLKQRQKEILKDEYRNGEWYADDIRSVDARTMPRADCWCFGFPCQDISIAGKCLGFNGARSSLFFATTRLVRDLEEEDRPGLLFIENVRNLLSINKGFDFARLLIELDEIGYDAEWQVLNSKDFGVPQNRERVFIIGHLRGKGGSEVFPIEGRYGQNSIHQIGKLGEANRDNPNRHRVYGTDGLAPTIGKMDGGGREPNVAMFCDMAFGAGIKTYDSADTLCAKYYKGPCCQSGTTGIALPIEGVLKLGAMSGGQTGSIYDANGLSPTLNTNGGEDSKIAIPVIDAGRPVKNMRGRRMKEDGEEMFTLTGQDRHGVAISMDPMGGVRAGMSENFSATNHIIEGAAKTLTNKGDGAVALKVKDGTKQGYAVAHEGDGITLTRPEDDSHRGRVGGGMAHTLSTSCNQGTMVRVDDDLEVYAVWSEKYQCHIAIRKLTPKECFRLQGWTDDYFEKAQFVNSDSQLYKQAGNGVTVSVIEAIARRMK